MSRKTENVPFVCAHCGTAVSALNNGSFRNHCPACLYSAHVDEFPGDRASECGGLMEPVGVDYHSAKGYMVLHRCTTCGGTGRNKIAVDCRQPDDMDLVRQLMVRLPPR